MMKHTPVGYWLGGLAVAAALAFGAASPVSAASPDNAANASGVVETGHAAGTTDMSARRRPWRRHRYAPQVYPYAYPYSYGYYRPRPYYYRPYTNPYYGPAPLFGFGFGPRYSW